MIIPLVGLKIDSYCTILINNNKKLLKIFFLKLAKRNTLLVAN